MRCRLEIINGVITKIYDISNDDLVESSLFNDLRNRYGSKEATDLYLLTETKEFAEYAKDKDTTVDTVLDFLTEGYTQQFPTNYSVDPVTFAELQQFDTEHDIALVDSTGMETGMYLPDISKRREMRNYQYQDFLKKKAEFLDKVEKSQFKKQIELSNNYTKIISKFDKIEKDYKALLSRYDEAINDRVNLIRYMAEGNTVETTVQYLNSGYKTKKRSLSSESEYVDIEAEAVLLTPENVKNKKIQFVRYSLDKNEYQTKDSNMKIVKIPGSRSAQQYGEKSWYGVIMDNNGKLDFEVGVLSILQNTSDAFRETYESLIRQSLEKVVTSGTSLSTQSEFLGLNGLPITDNIELLYQVFSDYYDVVSDPTFKAPSSFLFSNFTKASGTDRFFAIEDSATNIIYYIGNLEKAKAGIKQSSGRIFKELNLESIDLLLSKEKKSLKEGNMAAYEGVFQRNKITPNLSQTLRWFTKTDKGFKMSKVSNFKVLQEAKLIRFTTVGFNVGTEENPDIRTEFNPHIKTDLSEKMIEINKHYKINEVKEDINPDDVGDTDLDFSYDELTPLELELYLEKNKSKTLYISFKNKKGVAIPSASLNNYFNFIYDFIRNEPGEDIYSKIASLFQNPTNTDNKKTNEAIIKAFFVQANSKNQDLNLGPNNDMFERFQSFLKERGINITKNGYLKAINREELSTKKDFNPEVSVVDDSEKAIQIENKDFSENQINFEDKVTVNLKRAILNIKDSFTYAGKANVRKDQDIVKLFTDKKIGEQFTVYVTKWQEYLNTLSNKIRTDSKTKNIKNSTELLNYMSKDVKFTNPNDKQFIEMLKKDEVLTMNLFGYVFMNEINYDSDVIDSESKQKPVGMNFQGIDSMIQKFMSYKSNVYKKEGDRYVLNTALAAQLANIKVNYEAGQGVKYLDGILDEKTSIYKLFDGLNQVGFTKKEAVEMVDYAHKNEIPIGSLSGSIYSFLRDAPEKLDNLNDIKKFISYSNLQRNLLTALSIYNQRGTNKKSVSLDGKKYYRVQPYNHFTKSIEILKNPSKRNSMNKISMRDSIAEKVINMDLEMIYQLPVDVEGETTSIDRLSSVDRLIFRINKFLYYFTKSEYNAENRFLMTSPTNSDSSQVFLLSTNKPYYQTYKSTDDNANVKTEFVVNKGQIESVSMDFENNPFIGLIKNEYNRIKQTFDKYQKAQETNDYSKLKSKLDFIKGTKERGIGHYFMMFPVLNTEANPYLDEGGRTSLDIENNPKLIEDYNKYKAENPGYADTIEDFFIKKMAEVYHKHVIATSNKLLNQMNDNYFEINKKLVKGDNLTTEENKFAMIAYNYTMNEHLSNATSDQFFGDISTAATVNKGKFNLDQSIMLSARNHDKRKKRNVSPFKVSNKLKDSFTYTIINDEMGDLQLSDNEAYNSKIKSIIASRVFDYLRMRTGQIVPINDISSVLNELSKGLNETSRLEQFDTIVSNLLNHYGVNNSYFKNQLVELISEPINDYKKITKTDGEVKTRIDVALDEIYAQGVLAINATERDFLKTLLTSTDDASFMAYMDIMSDKIEAVQLPHLLPLIEELTKTSDIKSVGKRLKELIQIGVSPVKSFGVDHDLMMKCDEFMIVPLFHYGTRMYNMYKSMEESGVDKLPHDSAMKITNNEEMYQKVNQDGTIEVKATSQISYDNQGVQLESQGENKRVAKTSAQIIKIIMQNFEEGWKHVDFDYKGQLVSGTAFMDLLLKNHRRILTTHLEKFNKKYGLTDTKFNDTRHYVEFITSIVEKSGSETVDMQLLDALKLSGEQQILEIQKERKQDIENYRKVKEVEYSNANNEQEIESISLEEQAHIEKLNKYYDDAITEVRNNEDFVIPPFFFPSFKNIDQKVFRLYEKEVLDPKGSATQLVLNSVSYLETVPTDGIIKNRIIAFADGRTDNKLKPHEIVISMSFLDFAKDKNIELNDILVFKGDKYVLDTSKIPAEMLRAIGYRTPAQGPSSCTAFEIAGFILDGYANSVIAHESLITQAGWDFDHDKLYLMLPHIESIYSDNASNKVYEYLFSYQLGEYDKNRNLAYDKKIIDQFKSFYEIGDYGNTEATIRLMLENINDEFLKKNLNTIFQENYNIKSYKIVDENSAPHLQASQERFDLYYSFFNNEYIKGDINHPNTYGKLSKLGDRYDKLYKKDSMDPLSLEFKEDGFLTGVTAKGGVSISSDWNTGLMKLQMGNVKTLVRDKNINPDGKLGRVYQSDGITKCSKQIEMIQSNFVDNVKEGNANRVMLNTATAELWLALTYNAYTDEQIAKMVNIPIFREYLSIKERKGGLAASEIKNALRSRGYEVKEHKGVTIDYTVNFNSLHQTEELYLENEETNYSEFISQEHVDLLVILLEHEKSAKSIYKFMRALASDTKFLPENGFQLFLKEAQSHLENETFENIQFDANLQRTFNNNPTIFQNYVDIGVQGMLNLSTSTANGRQLSPFANENFAKLIARFNNYFTTASKESDLSSDDAINKLFEDFLFYNLNALNLNHRNEEFNRLTPIIGDNLDKVKTTTEEYELFDMFVNDNGVVQFFNSKNRDDAEVRRLLLEALLSENKEVSKLANDLMSYFIVKGKPRDFSSNFTRHILPEFINKFSNFKDANQKDLLKIFNSYLYNHLLDNPSLIPNVEHTLKKEQIKALEDEGKKPKQAEYLYRKSIEESVGFNAATLYKPWSRKYEKNKAVELKDEKVLHYPIIKIEGVIFVLTKKIKGNSVEYRYERYDQEKGVYNREIELLNYDNLNKLAVTSKPKVIENIQNQFTQSSTSVKIDFQEEATTGYIERTKKNASADATIDFGLTQKGEAWTKKAVDNNKKKYIGINTNNLIITSEMIDEIVNALNSVNAKTLNIAGMGIYNMKQHTQEQVDKFIYDLLTQIMNSPNLKTKIESIRSGGQTGFDEAGAKASIKLGLTTIVLAPKGWIFRDINGKDISDEQKFKARFITNPKIKTPITLKTSDDISTELKSKIDQYNKDKKTKFPFMIYMGADSNSIYYRGYLDTKTENSITENLYYNELIDQIVNSVNSKDLDYYFAAKDYEQLFNLFDENGELKSYTVNEILKDVLLKVGPDKMIIDSDIATEIMNDKEFVVSLQSVVNTSTPVPDVEIDDDGIKPCTFSIKK